MTIHRQTAVRTYALRLGESFDVVGWIGAHGQEADHRRPRVTLGPHRLHVQHDSFSELRSTRQLQAVKLSPRN